MDASEVLVEFFAGEQGPGAEKNINRLAFLQEKFLKMSCDGLRDRPTKWEFRLRKKVTLFDGDLL